jgi:hypothetical protein
MLWFPYCGATDISIANYRLAHTSIIDFIMDVHFIVPPFSALKDGLQNEKKKKPATLTYGNDV